jgi:hypothetical protein
MFMVHVGSWQLSGERSVTELLLAGNRFHADTELQMQNRNLQQGSWRNREYDRDGDTAVRIHVSTGRTPVTGNQ